MTDASSLLDILRGNRPAPSPSASPAASSSTVAATASSQAQPVAATLAAPNRPSESATSGSNDLDRLFQAFANPLQAPLMSPLPAPSPGQVEKKATTVAALEALVGQQSHSSAQKEQAKLNGSGQEHHQQSASLLGLLQGMGSKARVEPAATSEPTAAEESVQKQYSNKSTAATTLLSTLVGNGNASSPDSERASRKQDGTADESDAKDKKRARKSPVLPLEEPEKTNVPEQTEPAAPEPPSVKQPAQAPMPQFQRFVSPFDILEQTFAKEQEEKKRQAGQQKQSTLRVSSAPGPKPSQSSPRQRLSSVPAHVATVSPARPSVDSRVDAQDASPPVDLLPRHLLASAYVVKSSTRSHGQKLHNPAGQRQSVEIDVTKSHLNSISTRPIVHTPVSLFAVEAKAPRASSKIGVWSHGLVYVPGKGKIRVIDRETGHRTLIKAHKRDVLDLAVAPNADAATGKRAIATVGADGKLCIYTVPDRFDEQTANEGPGYNRLLDIQARSGVNFQLVRFHPQWPMKRQLVVSTDDDRLISLNLDKGSKAVNVGDESLFQELGSVAQRDSSIVDFAYAATGDVIFVLDPKPTFEICLSSEPSSVIESEQAWSPQDGVDQIALLTDVAGTRGRPFAVALSFNSGTRVEILSLAAGNLNHICATFELRCPPSAHDRPTADKERRDSNFSQMRWHAPTQTLFVSSSIRGSLWALHFTFDEATQEQQAGPGAGVKGEPGQARIDYMTEIPTEEPVVAVILDDSPITTPVYNSDDQRSELETVKLGALVFHPGGLHQIAFDVPVFEAGQNAQDEAPASSASDAASAVDLDDGVSSSPAQVAGSRRMSLESAILVRSEVEVVVDEADPLAHELLSSSSSANGVAKHNTELQRRPSVTPIEEEEDPMVAAQPAIDDDEKPTLASTAAASGTDETGPIIKTEDDVPAQGAPNTTAKPISKKQAKKAARAAKAAATNAQNGSDTLAVTNAWATGVAPAGVARKSTPAAPPMPTTDNSDIVSRLEASLPMLIAKHVALEVEKQAFTAEQRTQADSDRHEALLQSLGSRNGAAEDGDIKQMVEHTIQTEFREQIAPTVKQIVLTTLRAELPQSLSDELDRSLSRPDVTLKLARQFATAILPSVERSLNTIITSNVVPAFQKTMTTATDSCISTIRQEVTGVRKEIVKEQSKAVVGLETEVQTLRKDVSELKAALLRMEDTMSRMAAQPLAAAPSLSPVMLRTTDSSPRASQQQQTQHLPVQRQASISYAQSFPSQRQPMSPSSGYTATSPIVPPATPVGNYEEMFMNALLPEHEPDFRSLRHLISTAPPTRLEAVFPPAPQSANVSAPVVLSLAYRLAQVIGASSSPLQKEDLKQIEWLRRSLMAMDGKSPEVASFMPRILESVVASVQKRAEAVQAIGDYRGAEQCRMVEQYARAQLRIFQQ